MDDQNDGGQDAVKGHEKTRKSIQLAKDKAACEKSIEKIYKIIAEIIEQIQAEKGINSPNSKIKLSANRL